ncbi:hypothetical protein [Rhizobium sp. Rhizsp82]|uniref:hypothetical protein n=1 Tax=Rhizobium sp. Rhizsp82 TaxID=3243057 RepID=UPI0039B4F3DB
MSSPTRPSFYLPAGVLAANLLNMIGIIILPKIIDPDQLAIYSLASSIGLFLVSMFYEWNRVSISRYSVSKDVLETSRRRSALRHSNRLTSAVLIVVSLVSLIYMNNHYGLILGMACLFAISQALFEARQAYFRADFQNVSYATSIISRALCGLLLISFVGYASNSALYVMLAWCASYFIVLSFTQRRFTALTKVSPFHWETFTFLVKFGSGVTLVAIATTALQPLVRTLASEFIPLADSGKLMLAMDIPLKIVGVIGVSINILTLQGTMRASEFGERTLMLERIGMQISIVLAVILPTAVGFILVKQDFANAFIPTIYHDIYLQNVGWCMAAAGILVFRNAAIDSIFVIVGRPHHGLAGPTVAIFLTLIFTWFLLQFGVNSLAFSHGLFLGLLAGTVASWVVAVKLCNFPVEWGNIGRILFSTICMAAAVSMFVTSSNLVGLLAKAGLGAAVYVSFLILTNAFDLRRHLRNIYARRSIQ